eukprot:14759936-Heterocapsa_arctica.AAC.1
MPVVPAIDLDTERVGMDDGVDKLPAGDFVKEQETNQQKIEVKLHEDVKLAEAAGSSPPEAGAAATTPQLWDHEEPELTHLPYQA